MKFDSFTVNGEEYPLGYSLFEDNYEYDPRTDVRRAAFDAFSKKIKEYFFTHNESLRFDYQSILKYFFSFTKKTIFYYQNK